jgi:hypothetical protein
VGGAERSHGQKGGLTTMIAVTDRRGVLPHKVFMARFGRDSSCG